MSRKRSALVTEEQSTRLLRNLEETVQLSTGKPVELIRETPLCDLRCQTEKQEGVATRFKSFAQWVGRGTVLGDRTKTEQEINDMVDAVSG